MTVTKIKLLWLVLGVALFFFSYAMLAIDKNGEILKVIKGDIQGCEYLAGGGIEPMPHATIKTENDTYVTTIFQDCRSGTKVNVFVKRGILYFNTVYIAEKV